MTFTFRQLDLEFTALHAEGNPANFWRGQLGAALHRHSPPYYARIFDPVPDPHAPSGLRDPLRPFVVRHAAADSMSLHIFDVCGTLAEVVIECLQPSAHKSTIRTVDLDFEPEDLHRLTIRFVTPTDIRTDRPEFGVVFARARDRVSALRAAFGEGPLDIDFQQIGQRARTVALIATDLTRHTERRRSNRNGQTYPFGGFTGTAIYEGDLKEFVPVLRAAQHTGIGRKTVWGHGEIEITGASPES